MSGVFDKIIPARKKKEKEEEEKKTEPEKEGKTEKKTASQGKEQTPAPQGYSGKPLIKDPVVTEKSRDMSMEGKYIFDVKVPANKKEVKKEVEKRYGVTVKKVNIIKKKIRPRQFRGQEGKEGTQKKAIVTLKEGDKIDIFPA